MQHIIKGDWSHQKRGMFMNSCFNSCCNCNCSKDHCYIGPTGAIGPQSIQGIQGEKGETGLAWPIAIPSTAEITGQQDTSNVRVSDVNLLMKKYI